MRYFLDTEFNAFGGALISLGLAPEFGDREYYAVIALDEELHPWVVQNVLPYLDMVPPGLITEPLPRIIAAAELAAYLAGDDDIVIVADWPEDLAHFCRLLVVGPGERVALGAFRMQLVDCTGFSTAENSEVPHNALHDARALRHFILSGEY